jgi:hypothetical protein
MNEPDISPVAEMLEELFLDLRQHFCGGHTFKEDAECYICRKGKEAYLTGNKEELLNNSLLARMTFIDNIMVHDNNGFNIVLSMEKLLQDHTCKALSKDDRALLIDSLLNRFVDRRTWMLRGVIKQILFEPSPSRVPEPAFTLAHKNFWVKFILVLVERLACGHQFNKTKRCSVCDKGIVAYREFADKEFPKMTETKRVATELMATATSNAEAIRRILGKFVCSARGERAVHDLLVNAFHITLDSKDGYIKPRIVLSTALFGDAESGVIHDHFVKKHKD